MQNPLSAQNEAFNKLFGHGKAAIFSSRVDPRFCYTMYVPPGIGAPGAEPPELIVAIHGSSRDSFMDFRDGFAEFGRWLNCVILCPLFPIGVFGDDNGESYKYLKERDLRYDQVLLGMVDELAQRLGTRFERFGMWGYSGGGQFVQRFIMLHPERVWAASIGAPGVVTLLDFESNWWVGVKDFEAQFGKPLDVAALRRVAVQMLVGDCDVEEWMIQVHEGGTTYMPGINDSGRTRPERLDSLRKSFETHDIAVQFDLVPGASHSRMDCIGTAKDFLSAQLASLRAGQTQAEAARAAS